MDGNLNRLREVFYRAEQRLTVLHPSTMRHLARVLQVLPTEIANPNIRTDCYGWKREQ